MQRLPTAAKLLLILTAVLLPIGAALAWLGEQRNSPGQSTRSKGATRTSHERRSQAIESLIARNALALRIAANGALARSARRRCLRAKLRLRLRSRRRSPSSFELRDRRRQAVCALTATSCRNWRTAADRAGRHPHLARSGRASNRHPRRRHRRDGDREHSRRRAAHRGARRPADVQSMNFATVREHRRSLGDDRSESRADELSVTDWPIGNGNLLARVGIPHQRITTFDRLLLLLPLLMWIAAAAHHLVARQPACSIRPLKRLEQAVLAYQPGEGELELPRKLGPSEEIQELRNAFARTIDRVEESERETTVGARGAAAAGPRGPSPGEEQPAGGRLAAQHPWPERRDAGGPRRPMPGSAAGSAHCRSSIATISPRWRRIAGFRCGRW